ncbi:MAG TPA: mannose-1-phosphate guanylyltransferase, partial [Cryptosporangiaceae bacterium]|nr:mannose-1-phosphate guanylyltransferase [Cryptosporangiaceae bacterium]
MTLSLGDSAFYPVVPAGGSGTRLWPLSRAGDPKFLHALAGGDRTLIQATADRLGRLAPLDRLHVVTGASHAAAIARQLPDLPAGNIVVEPAPRDSGPAIGLAAALLARRDPTAVMGSFAADHLVGDVDTFVQVIRTAIAVAADGLLVTVGITPTGPDTGYGYIRCAQPLSVPGAYAVGAFKEKPTAELARAYLDSGQYVWNASMFVWRVDALLDELARQRPALHAGLLRIADAWDSPDRDAVLGAVWPTLEKISID